MQGRALMRQVTRLDTSTELTWLPLRLLVITEFVSLRLYYTFVSVLFFFFNLLLLKTLRMPGLSSVTKAKSLLLLYSCC